MLPNVIDVVWGSEHISPQNLHENLDLISEQQKLSDTSVVYRHGQVDLVEKERKIPTTMMDAFHYFNTLMSIFGEEPGH